MKKSNEKEASSELTSRPSTPDREEEREWVEPTRYIVIPIHERIGVETLRDDPLTVTAKGIEEALKYAARKKIDHIVFTLDTPGGYIYEAGRIAEAITAHAGDITFHAVIKRSISAGMSITYACDHVWFDPSAAAGGALSYTMDSSGSIEYDAKSNSIWAAELANLAQTRGHNPVIASAMVLPEKEVYTWLDEEGERVVADHMPEGVEAERIDGPETVLTLTRKLAVRLGVGQIVESGHEGIGEIIGTPRWKKFGNRYGRNVLAKATKAIIDDERDRRELYDDMINYVDQSANAMSTVQGTISSAMRADPKNFSYTYMARTGELTAASKRKWKRNTDSAIRVWQQALSQISAIVRKRNDASRLLEEHHETPVYFSFESTHAEQGERLRESISDLEQYGTQLNAWRNQAENNIARLQAERNKIYF